MASNPGPRLVVVDDTDNNINYNGQGWFQDHGSLDLIGNFGPTYLHTSHGTRSNTSLDFSFNGTNVHVYGTPEVRNVSGILDPTWECFIDGNSFSNSSATRIPIEENNSLLCEPSSPLPDGEHQLTINIVSRGSTFWIDDIKYVPSPNASLESASILVDNSDPAITFSSEWHALAGVENITLQTGATMQFSFIGKSVSWYAFIPKELPHTPAIATYSIDGGPPVQFLLIGLPASATNTIYNQRLFTTPDLAPGLHTLLVTNQGNSSTTPLPLDYLIITNGSTPDSSSSGFSSSTSSSGSSSTTSSSGSSSTTSSSGFSSSTFSSGSSSSHSSSSSQTSTVHASGGSKVPTGAIVGGVIGGIIFLAALFTFVFFWRKRKRNLADQAAYNAQQPLTFDPGKVPYHDVSSLDNTHIPHPHKYSFELVPVRVGQIPHLPSIDADSSHDQTLSRFSESTDAGTPYDNSDSQYGEVNKKREAGTG